MSNNLIRLEQLSMTQGNRVICLEGHKGCGKTTVLQEFVLSHKNVIQVEHFSNYDDYLAPLTTGIRRFSKELKLHMPPIFESTDLTYEESVLEQLLNICSEQSCVIIFHDFINYNTELISFISKSIPVILRKGINCCVVIEIDTDDASYLSMLRNIYSFPRLEHIYFPEIVSEELEKIFLEEHPNISISQEDLGYIISSANRNPALLNIIVNYLTANQYIVESGSYSICKPIQYGILADVLREDFYVRFNRLDEIMKVTFLKSSMFGMEFYASMLENSFNIIAANETLERIEKYSNLLFQKDSKPNLYSFSNAEALSFASSIIDEDKRKDWANILHDYYSRLWRQSLCKDDPNTENYAARSAAYAVIANNRKAGTSYYIAALFSAYNHNNFKQSLLYLQEIEKLENLYSERSVIHMHLIEIQASCFEILGYYEKAVDTYLMLIQSYHDIISFDENNAQYHMAFCTYYTSRVDDALSITEALLKKLEIASRADSLYYQTVSLLATLYREKGNPKFREMFLLAINECKEHNMEYEYYVQLRKADLSFEASLSIPMLKEAAEYFKNNHYRKEYGKAVQNLGTDYLCLDNVQESVKYLTKSRQMFSKFGSTDEIYSINCLGVCQTAINKDIEGALRLFFESEQMRVNDYKKMTIYINIAACYQKLHQFEKSEDYINKGEELPACSCNKDIDYYKRTPLLARAFLLMEKKHYRESLKIFRSCLCLTLKNNQKYLAAACIVELCELIGESPSDMELSFSQMSHDKLFDHYYRNHCLFHTLRFIE